MFALKYGFRSSCLLHNIINRSINNRIHFEHSLNHSQNTIYYSRRKLNEFKFNSSLIFNLLIDSMNFEIDPHPLQPTHALTTINYFLYFHSAHIQIIKFRISFEGV